MWKTLCVFVIIQAVGSLRRAVDDPANAGALQSVANGGLEFSGQFYKATARTVPGNLISSPVSASSALSMLAYGARGATETALKSALHFSNDDNVQRKGLKTLVEELNDSPGVELRLANKIFVANDVTVKPEYQQLTEDVFKSTVQKVDFSKSAEASKTINDWCEQQTNSQIKNVIPPDTLNPAIQAVLVNAVYFKGKWAIPFKEILTRDELFYLEDGSAKNVSTMLGGHRGLNYGVLPDVKARFAELPYQGGQVSMFIILPDEVSGLKSLQQNFAQFNLNRLLNDGSNTLLDLTLPKFEIETTIDLEQPLSDIGMGGIFKDSADFNGMFDVPVKIGKALQKAYIKVDEEGTKAAAVTVVLPFTARPAPPPLYLEFHVNRPFYYAIVKRMNSGSQKSGIVLFQGHYTGGD